MLKSGYEIKLKKVQKNKIIINVKIGVAQEHRSADCQDPRDFYCPFDSVLLHSQNQAQIQITGLPTQMIFLQDCVWPRKLWEKLIYAIEYSQYGLN